MANDKELINSFQVIEEKYPLNNNVFVDTQFEKLFINDYTFNSVEITGSGNIKNFFQSKGLTNEFLIDLPLSPKYYRNMVDQGFVLSQNFIDRVQDEIKLSGIYTNGDFPVTLSIDNSFSKSFYYFKDSNPTLLNDIPKVCNF